MLAAAPDNWGVGSINTQRKLYSNLYREKAKTGLDTNHQKVMKAKLDALSPDGSFDGFISELRRGEGMIRYSRMTDTKYYAFNDHGRLQETASDITLLGNTFGTITSIDENEESSMDKTNTVTDLANSVHSTIPISNKSEDDRLVEEAIATVREGMERYNNHDDEHRYDDKSIQSSLSDCSRDSAHDYVLPIPISVSTPYSDINRKDGLLIDDNDHENNIDKDNDIDTGKDLIKTGIHSSQHRSNDVSLSQTSDKRDGDLDLNSDSEAESNGDEHEDDKYQDDYENTSNQSNHSLTNEIIDKTYSQSSSSQNDSSANNSQSKSIGNMSSSSQSMSQLGDKRTGHLSVVRQLSKQKSYENTDNINDRKMSVESVSNTSDKKKGKKKRGKYSAAASIAAKIEQHSRHIIHKRRVSLSEADTDETEGLLKTTEESERRWVRKVKYTLTQLGKPKEDVLKPKLSALKHATSFYTQKRLLIGSADRRTSSLRILGENEILSKTSFGSYRALDMTKAMAVFLALPAYDTLADNGKSIPKQDTSKNLNNLVLGMNDSKRVNLSEFIMSDFVQSRPHFEQELRKYLKKRTSKFAGFGSGDLALTLQEIIASMCPLMNYSQLSECYEYIALQMRIQIVEENPVEEEIIPEETIITLRKMFNFFDKERTGRVKEQEILQLMETESKKFYAKQQADFLEGGGIEEETKVEESAVKKMLASVTLKVENEIDFEEFVQIFKNVV